MRAPRSEHQPLALAGLVRRRGWLALLCILLLPAGVFVVAAQQPKAYEARVIVEGEPGSAFIQVGSVSVPDPTSARLARTHATTSGVIEDVARSVGRPYSSVDKVGATIDERTGWVTLSVTAESPELAVAAAEALPESLRRNLRDVRDGGVRTRITEVERSLASTREPGRREELTETLRELRAARMPATLVLPLVERTAGARVAAPHPHRDATLALVLAVLLAPAFMLTAERVDRKVRRTASLPDLTAAPLLATIPARSGRIRRSAQDAGAFAQLRDGLTYLSADVPLRVIAITSALAGEGRTTVASELAVAFARTGRRVVVVDADLRVGDGVATHLGVHGAPGLSGVLRGSDLDGALQVGGEPGAEVHVLPSGTAVADPGELLGSAGMSALIKRLCEGGDLVILDTAPLLLVSDALPLLHQASGVVCVVRLGVTPGDAVRRMSRLIRTARGRILGVVATGGAATGARSAPRAKMAQSQRMS